MDPTVLYKIRNLAPLIVPVVFSSKKFYGEGKKVTELGDPQKEVFPRAHKSGSLQKICGPEPYFVRLPLRYLGGSRAR